MDFESVMRAHQGCVETAIKTAIDTDTYLVSHKDGEVVYLRPISSVGQSADLLSQVSLVQVQDRPNFYEQVKYYKIPFPGYFTEGDGT